MTYDDLKEVTEGLTLRSIPASVSPELPRGSFEWDAFPKDYFNTSESPMVHFYNIIFGMKMRLTLMPWEKRTRMLATDMTYSYYQIPSASRSKSPPTPVCKSSYGTPYRAKWMTQNPKVGRKVLQLKRFELSSAATRKPATRQVHLKTKTMMKLMQVLTISSSMALGVPLVYMYI